MIINLGPQHPGTRGVLRLMLELRGEEVLRCKPTIGYLHTGMEKTGENLTYMQGGTNVTRMDYVSPLNNELVFSMATEKLLGIDGDIPERAVWMRMLLSELNRRSSHLRFLATNGMDNGAVSLMIDGWRGSGEVLGVFQKVQRPRWARAFPRPGGGRAALAARRPRGAERGNGVACAGICIDPVRSTNSRKILRVGLNFVVVALVLRLPFRPDRYYAFPVLWRVYRKKGLEGHCKRTQLAAELIRHLASATLARSFRLLPARAHINTPVRSRLQAHRKVSGTLPTTASYTPAPMTILQAPTGTPRPTGTRLAARGQHRR